MRCDVHSAAWRDSPSEAGILELEITADRYLHRMVRYLVGTLVEIGLDGIDVNLISLDHLKVNKKASGRYKDLNDLENLS